jgi:hypothetical protein
MFELAVVSSLLAAAIVMFAINKLRLDAVALMMLTALPFTACSLWARRWPASAIRTSF